MMVDMIVVVVRLVCLICR